MNTRQEKLTKIEAVIRVVCTELVVPHDFGENGPEFELLPIHLEHILRAISEKHGDTVAEKCAADIVFKFYDTINKPFSLQSQSDEFISWLYEVLVGE